MTGLAVAVLVLACGGEEPHFDMVWTQTTSRVRTPTITTTGPDGATVTHQRPHLVDSHGRYVHVRGINVSGSHKAPPTEEFPSLYPLPTDPALKSKCQTTVPMPVECIPARTVSYVGRPFPLEDADRWFGELAGLGFNSVRLITNWESIQPFRPGTCDGREGYSPQCYDLKYLDYYESLLQSARDHGLYVLVDMHQDVFSRYLMSYYNEAPKYGSPTDPIIPERGSVEQLLLALFPPYTDWVRGHGAPRWVVATCLPEKKLDSKWWGVFRGLGLLRKADGDANTELLTAIQELAAALSPDGPIPGWVEYILTHVPSEPFGVDETSDLLPITPWLLNGALSLDVDRCFAALFAGDVVFPGLVVDTDGRTKRRVDVANPDALPNLKDYLQTAYTDAWLQLVERTRKYDNVIGYDIINEPVGAFLMLALAATFVQTNAGGDPAIPSDQGPLEDLLIGLVGEGLAQNLLAVIGGLALLPPDGQDETLQKWGIADIDLGAALSINFSFDAKHLQPFYERVGGAIAAADPNAIIWFESSTSLRTITGPSPFFDLPLTRPQGIEQLVYAPHWYPDIYPRAGIGSPPREFQPDEWLYRDFTEDLRHHIEQSSTWLGNVPVVFGEFGTYFNFGGIQASIDSGYAISAHVLNSYYEAFEALNTGSMLWVFSAENDYNYGELWNHEDFSIIDPSGEPRAWPAYVRTYARATSGKLIHQQFNSQYHFHDPDHGTAQPERHYDLVMAMRETDAPTEVFVPRRQYPNGFYVWLSDGRAFYDRERQVLYWYPSRQKPGTQHTLHIEPHMLDREALGWAYFFDGHHMITGQGDPFWTSAVTQ